MKKSVFLSGGIGRVIAGIPALEKFVEIQEEEGHEVRIFCHGWTEIFLSNKILQNKVFDINQKGVFDWIKNSFIIVPEPYYDSKYMNQLTNIAGAWGNELLTKADSESLHDPRIYLSKQEKSLAHANLDNLRKMANKDKVVIFQPYGSGATIDPKTNDVIDSSNRSLNSKDVISLADKLSNNAAIVYFGDDALFPEKSVMANTQGVHPQRGTRFWASMISEADAFIGIDSSGNHIAHAVNTKSMIILGSTYVENVSYKSEHISVFEKKNFPKQYVPMRINQIDASLADRNNDGIMDFTQEEIQECYEQFINHLGWSMSKNTNKNQDKTVLNFGPGKKSQKLGDVLKKGQAKNDK